MDQEKVSIADERSHTCSSRASSSVLKNAAARRAELLCRQRLVKERQELEDKHLAIQLQRQQEEHKLRKEKDLFDLQLEIEVANAGLKALEEYGEVERRVRINLPENSPEADERSANDVVTTWLSSQYLEPNGQVDEDNRQMPNLSPQVEKIHHETNTEHCQDDSPKFNEMKQEQKDSASDFGELTKLLIKQQIRASLPAQQIEIFRGDPLKYTAFMKSFEFGVEDKTTDGRDRLNYLCQYTSGEAKNLVNSCLHYEDAEEGYNKAKQLLAKKYGNGHIIAQAVLTKANNWPVIKAEEATSLNNYSLFLNECQNMASTVNALNEFDHSKTIQMLVEKLPFRLRSMWRNKVYEVEEERGISVTFKDLVRFVDRQAQIISNPVFGNLRDSSHHKSNTSETSRKSSVGKGAFSTVVKDTSRKNTNEQKKHCQFCKENFYHTTRECKKFAQLDPKEKSTFCFKNGLCFGCLEVGHTKSNCKIKELCKCTKCQGDHPTALHKDQQKDTKSYSASPTQTQITTGCAGVLGAGASKHTAKNPKMAIVPVLVKASSSHDHISTYAFLDSGCGAVFVDSQICSALKVATRKRSLVLRTLNSEQVVDSAVVIDSLQVAGVEGNEFIDLPTAYVKDNIPVSTDDMITADDLKEWSHLSNIQLSPLRGKAIPKVTIIIGMNVPAATTPTEVLTGIPGDPYGVKIPIGWVVYGMPGRPNSSLEQVNYLNIQDGLTHLEEQFKRYVNLDFSERTDAHEESALSVEDMRFLDIARETAVLRKCHYEMAIPLKRSTVRMPDNRQMVEKRAEYLKRRFVRNPEFKEKYVQAMEETIAKGYAERVQDCQKDRSDGKVWFIPHHGVYHAQKQKMRVVYDCAAECGGTSLNREVLQGPDLTSGLVGVLMRFRQEPVAIKADIEAMFYQVKVRIEDRDLLRFLWWPDGDLSCELQEYRMTVHVFGAASSPSCANFALQKTAEDNEQRYEAGVTNAVKNNFYVDDLCKSVRSEEEAKNLSREVKNLLAEGGFRLTKWVSNKREVLQSIPKDEWSKELKNLKIEEDILPSERTLGVLWCIENDSFSFDIDVKDREPTRRGMLSIVSSIYDPLGMVSAAVMPAKILLQELCRLKLSWDAKIPEDFLPKWNQWLIDLPKLEHILVDRCFKPKGFEIPTNTQLHHFADASEKGYGVVSYLRLQNSRGQVHCSFVTSKARVAPLKQQSIPRLELTAATVAVRVHNQLVRELEIHVDEVYFWTDSTTVIKYIANESTRFKTFVANRLAVIRESSKLSQWKYVTSEQNPADDCSRGLEIDKFIVNERWFRGPPFLWQSEEQWPAPVNIEVVRFHDPEVKRGNRCQPSPSAQANCEPATDVVMAEAVICEEPGLDPVRKLIEYYSEWNRLKRGVAWWLRLKDILTKKATADQKRSTSRFLTVTELQKAEDTILKWVQQSAFAFELKRLQKENIAAEPELAKCIKQLRIDKALHHLDPIFQDGLVRVGGRIQAARISEETKHQVILPQHSHVSTLIVRNIHQKNHHQGKNHVLAELRKKYWILRAGAVVKSELKKCVTCKKIQARLSHQKMANLPLSRVHSEMPAFSFTGMDYFGPFNVKQGRSLRKRYGVIFTCMTSRAIHIEVAESLDTSSCINALRRFIARRGCVKEILSDNGSNLVGAKSELRKALQEWNQEELANFTTKHDIVWKFNPPAASHFGGIWERQIRTIRKVLQAMLNEQHVRECRDDEQLRTLMCEVEFTVNSRPLTHASDDPKDLDALSPNDLLLLRPSSLPSPPPAVFTSKDMYARRRWRQMQYLADLFWKRWTAEYLTDLQHRQKWIYPQRNIHSGDVVLVADNRAPRNSWPLGLVLETFPDSNGLVRSARVKTNSAVLVRPVAKLCLLLEQETSLEESTTTNAK